MRGTKIITALSGAFLISAVAYGQSPHSARADYTYSYKGEWSKDKEYKGDYRNTRGDTVQYGEWNGKKLYWWAKFYAKGDVPGMSAPEGGTSPWVLINSAAYDPNGSSKYEWKGWNGQFESSIKVGDALIPTWKDGAEGAYTIIHDDIGGIPYETGIKPGWEISKDYPDIRTGWGVICGDGDERDYYDKMREMVKAGHEMVCHSYDHTSSAEQWAWGEIGEKLPTSVDDPSIPTSLGGLTVVGPTPADKNPNAWDKAYTRVKAETELGTIEYNTDWTGVNPANNIGEKVKKGTAEILIEPVKVTPASGVETVSFLGKDYYVIYTKKDTINGVNEGKILATKIGWQDYDPKVMDASWKADGGRAVWTLKVKCSDSWADRHCFKREITDATNRINEVIYDPIRKEGGFGRWFHNDKKCEYFVYPYDAYSSVTHDSIMAHGYVAARGGAKSGRPLPGDFFVPTRIDFDAFYMVDSLHTTLFPDNPHSLMTLQGMVDSIVSQKGYMIRELHAIVDVTGKPWEAVNDGSQGGWWGGITTYLYRMHMDYCQDLIDKHKLVVYTPSDAIRYKMTVNNVTGASMQKNGDSWDLSVTAKPWQNNDDRWHDEISIIVKFDQGVNNIDVKYKDGGHPIKLPRKMTDDGSVWSVNVDPYLGDAIIYPGAKWSGEEVAISSSAITKTNPHVTSLLINKTVDLTLPKGKYAVQLFNVRGQMIKNVSLSSMGISDNNQINLSPLGQGMVIMRVKKNNATIYAQRFMLK